MLRIRGIYSKRRVTKEIVAYSPGFGTKIHARTVVMDMDLHFVEPGKKHREHDMSKWPHGKRSPGAINGRSLQP